MKTLSILPLFFFFISVFGSLGCSGTAENDCHSIAQKQCQLWFSCKCQGASCQEGSYALGSETECVEKVDSSCRNQAATLNDADSSVEACLNQMKEFSCIHLQQNRAQEKPPSPPACRYFL